MRDKIRFIVFIHIFIIHSCKQNEEKWKILDADSFTIEVPNHFRYEEKKGIDSALGEIIGDSLRILFNFGYYTDQEPRTNEEFAEKMIFRGDLLKEVRQKLNIPDTFSHKIFFKQVTI